MFCYIRVFQFGQKVWEAEGQRVCKCWGSRGFALLRSLWRELAAGSSWLRVSSCQSRELGSLTYQGLPPRSDKGRWASSAGWIPAQWRILLTGSLLKDAPLFWQKIFQTQAVVWGSSYPVLPPHSPFVGFRPALWSEDFASSYAFSLSPSQVFLPLNLFSEASASRSAYVTYIYVWCMWRVVCIYMYVCLCVLSVTMCISVM